MMKVVVKDITDSLDHDGVGDVTLAAAVSSVAMIRVS